MKKNSMHCLAVVIMAILALASCSKDDENGNGGEIIAGVGKKVVVISDTHINDKRAAEGGWAWLNERRSVLIDFLNNVAANSNEYGTLVVAGDMFDEWVAPMDLSPYTNVSGAESRTESEQFQVLVRDNKDILDAFRKVRNAGIELVYVPGNHDLTCTKEDFDSYLPGLFTQARDAYGLGAYTPADMPEVVIEHGHRYDYSNMPNPISTPGGYLPVGYVVSKYTSTILSMHADDKNDKKAGGQGSFLDQLASMMSDPLAPFMYNILLQNKGINGWLTYEEFCNAMTKMMDDVAMVQEIQNNGMILPEMTEELNHRVANVTWAMIIGANPPKDPEELLDVLFTEVKFPEPYNESYRFCDIIPYFNENKTVPEEPALFKDMWTDQNWAQLLQTNKVQIPLAYAQSVIAGAMSTVIDGMASIEYFANPASNKRIVVFGHTHRGMVAPFNDEKKGKCIYANSGCWVDDKWGNPADGVTFQTYVELQKTETGYNVTLKKWGTKKALATDNIKL